MIVSWIFVNSNMSKTHAVSWFFFLSENHSLLFGWLLNILIYMDSIMCNIIVIYNDRYKRAMKEVTPSVKDQ